MIDEMKEEALLKRKPDSTDKGVNRTCLMSNTDSLWASVTTRTLKIRKSSTRNTPESDIQITLDAIHETSKNLTISFKLNKIPDVYEWEQKDRLR